MGQGGILLLREHFGAERVCLWQNVPAACGAVRHAGAGGQFRRAEHLHEEGKRFCPESEAQQVAGSIHFRRQARLGVF